jgi:hypothetical protein
MNNDVSIVPMSSMYDIRTVAQLVEATTVPIEDPFGPIRGAHAKLRAPLCQATISTDCNLNAVVKLRENSYTSPYLDIHLDGEVIKTKLQMSPVTVYLFLCMASNSSNYACHRKRDANGRSWE